MGSFFLTSRPVSCCCEFASWVQSLSPTCSLGLCSPSPKPAPSDYPFPSCHPHFLSHSSNCSGLALQRSAIPQNPFGQRWPLPTSFLSCFSPFPLPGATSWPSHPPWKFSSHSMPRHTWILQPSPPDAPDSPACPHCLLLPGRGPTTASYCISCFKLHTGAPLKLVHLGPLIQQKPLAPPPPSTLINKGTKL